MKKPKTNPAWRNAKPEAVVWDGKTGEISVIRPVWPHPPERRFVMFDPKVHRESMKDARWPGFVEVPMHVENKGGLMPNPAYRDAEYAEQFLRLDEPADVSDLERLRKVFGASRKP